MVFGYPPVVVGIFECSLPLYKKTIICRSVTLLDNVIVSNINIDALWDNLLRDFIRNGRIPFLFLNTCEVSDIY